jgi:TonB family protein
MAVFDPSQPKANRVFISYSSIDRIRTNGLGLLLEAMGHQVFHDHRTIKPGMRWQAALQEGLDESDSLMLFWTKHAAKSEWVRKEYEYYAATFPDRPLIPVLGDETPLPELLKTRQHADFAPLVNEVLEMKRRMKKEGAGAAQIQQAVMNRLDEAGIEIKGKKKRMLFLFLGFGWLSMLLRYPRASAEKVGRGVVEKTAQLTVGQALALGVAAMVGFAGEPFVPDAVPRLGPERPAIIRASSGDSESGLAHLDEAFSSHSSINMRLDEISERLNGLVFTWADSLNQCRLDVRDLRGEINRAVAQISAAGVLQGPLLTEADALPVREQPRTVTVPTAVVPDGVPSGLDATADTSGRVSLVWTDNATNAEGFEIQRCTGAVCTDFSRLARTAGRVTSFTDTSVDTFTYRYRVRAYNDAGQSAWSNIDLAAAGRFERGSVQMPKLKDQARALRIITDHYPADLKAAGVKGDVVVNVWVNESGVVSLRSTCEPFIKSGSGNDELDQAALTAVQELEFESASDSGRRVPLCVAIPISFR